MNSKGGSKIFCIVVPYRNLYQWSLAIEFALDIRKKGYPIEIKILNLPNLNFFRSILKSLLMFRSINPEVLSILRLHGISIKNYHLFPTLSCLKLRKNYSIKYKKELEISLAHIVNDLFTEKLDFTQKSHRVTIRKHLRDVIHTNKMLEKIDFSKFEIIYTINGRFSSNRAIVKFLRSKEFTVKIVDLASNGKYLVVDNAQSMFEHINLIDDFWRNYPAESRFQDAEEYFQAKVTAIKNKSDPWIAFMTQSPKFDLPNKKIAIFYTTTQLEFVANDDVPAGDTFTNQNEALVAVYNWLRENGWFLIVRRHPRSINTDQSVQADDLLLNLPQGQDLLIINPEDKINSYELAEKADLIISYGSSIAAELIFENKKPVVSVGITPWFLYDKTNHLLSERELKSIDPNFIKKSEPWIVLPWALYILKAGSNFKYITKNKENRLVLNNVQIWLDFWPWLKSRVKN